jgi:hypothetical protein
MLTLRGGNLARWAGTFPRPPDVVGWAWDDRQEWMVTQATSRPSMEPHTLLPLFMIRL